MGAHPRRDKAVEHALREAVERDRLPPAWTPQLIRTRKLDPRPLPLWEKLRDARLEAHLFELAPEVVGALLFDLDEGPIPVTAGYCCAETQERAAHGALLEAAQSRLTEVHGAREDVAPQNREQRGLREACERSKPSKKLQTQSLPLQLPKHVAIVELAREPLYVVKIYAPEMRVSELL